MGLHSALRGNANNRGFSLHLYAKLDGAFNQLNIIFKI